MMPAPNSTAAKPVKVEEFIGRLRDSGARMIATDATLINPSGVCSRHSQSAPECRHQSGEIRGIAGDAIDVEIRTQQHRDRTVHGKPSGEVAVRIADRIADHERSSDAIE